MWKGELGAIVGDRVGHEVGAVNPWHVGLEPKSVTIRGGGGLD